MEIQIKDKSFDLGIIKKTIRALKKKKTSISYILIFSFIVFGSFAATYISYAKAKSELEETTRYISTLENEANELENENREYKENLSVLEERASDIESRLTELQDKRKNIEETLDKINDKTSSSSNGALMSCYEDYDSSSEGIQSFLIRLSSIENMVDSEESAYVQVLGNAEHTLAASSRVPNLWPIYGIVTSEFGYRTDPVYGYGAFHQGLDIGSGIGDPVMASASGKVKKSEFNPSYGYMIEISHGNGYTSVYAHNSKLIAEVGDDVAQGDIISYTGATGKATGSHLHFEIHLNGKLINPRDVLSWHK